MKCKFTEVLLHVTNDFHCQCPSSSANDWFIFYLVPSVQKLLVTCCLISGHQLLHTALRLALGGKNILSYWDNASEDVWAEVVEDLKRDMDVPQSLELRISPSAYLGLHLRAGAILSAGREDVRALASSWPSRLEFRSHDPNKALVMLSEMIPDVG